MLVPVPSAYGEVTGQSSRQKLRTIEAADLDILVPFVHFGTEYCFAEKRQASAVLEKIVGLVASNKGPVDCPQKMLDVL